MDPVRVSVRALPTSAGTAGALQEQRWPWHAEKGAFLLPEIHHAHTLRSDHFSASASFPVHPGATTPECASLYVQGTKVETVSPSLQRFWVCYGDVINPHAGHVSAPFALCPSLPAGGMRQRCSQLPAIDTLGTGHGWCLGERYHEEGLCLSIRGFCCLESVWEALRGSGWSAALGNDEGCFQLPQHGVVFPGAECWSRRVRWVRVPLGSYLTGPGACGHVMSSPSPSSVVVSFFCPFCAFLQVFMAVML